MNRIGHCTAICMLAVVALAIVEQNEKAAGNMVDGLPG
jgi:hypothetical protein